MARANSNPEVEVRELVTRLELDLAHPCGPIQEAEEEEVVGRRRRWEEEEGVGRARAATMAGSTPSRGARRERERAPYTPPFSPQFLFLQLFQAVNPVGVVERPIILPQVWPALGS